MRNEIVLRALVTLAVAVVVVLVVLQTPNYPWGWGDIWMAANRDLMLSGLLWTLIVSAASMVLGLVLGIVAGLGRMSRRVVPNQLATLYVELIRGTPLLVQIFIVFYCVDALIRIGREDIGRVALGVIALGFFAGAYIAEIVRAGIESVPRGQMEAARSLGMGHRQAMIHVIAPQALRNALPPLAGQFISLVKDSSLLMFFGVTELAKRADQVYSHKHAPFEVYLPLAALYLLLTLPLSRLTQRLERKLGGTLRGQRI